jgi:hypothetical protein
MAQRNAWQNCRAIEDDVTSSAVAACSSQVPGTRDLTGPSVTRISSVKGRYYYYGLPHTNWQPYHAVPMYKQSMGITAAYFSHRVHFTSKRSISESLPTSRNFQKATSTSYCNRANASFEGYF